MLFHISNQNLVATIGQLSLLTFHQTFFYRAHL
ncbi:protein of unknown function [Rhodovastum atsumiense]|nr:protein of unknown function [Rhodovastum atsumiense]